MLLAGMLKNESLESTATQHGLLGLTAGRLYNITMVTEASDLQSSVTIEGQTGREGDDRRGGDRRRQADLSMSFQFPLQW